MSRHFKQELVVGEFVYELNKNIHVQVHHDLTSDTDEKIVTFPSNNKWHDVLLANFKRYMLVNMLYFTQTDPPHKIEFRHEIMEMSPENFAFHIVRPANAIIEPYCERHRAEIIREFQAGMHTINDPNLKRFFKNGVLRLMRIVENKILPTARNLYQARRPPLGTLIHGNEYSEVERYPANHRGQNQPRNTINRRQANDRPPLPEHLGLGLNSRFHFISTKLPYS